MLDLLKSKVGDKVRVVGDGAPGFAKIGDILEIVDIGPDQSVRAKNKYGEEAVFFHDCGLSRLEKLEEKWKSSAKWPDGLIVGCEIENVTMDFHDTEEQAKSVCQMLEKEGLGGERIHFPISTWVEQI